MDFLRLIITVIMETVLFSFSRKLITKKKISYFNYQNHCIFDKNTKNEKPFLDMDYLQDYSPKMSALFNIVKDNRGLVYINNRFIYGGALPIALMLEQNGFERYTFQGEGQLLNYNANKVGGGGKKKKYVIFVVITQIILFIQIRKIKIITNLKQRNIS